MDNLFKKIVLEDEIRSIIQPYKPRKLAVLNKKAWVEISLHKGAFPYGMHFHENDDELFICIKGDVTIKLDDRDIHLSEGELLHIKAGQKHMPVADNDCYLIRIKTVPHMEATLEDGTVI